MKRKGLPAKQGLYDPQFEHDACGMGFVANIKGRKSHEIVRQALTVLGTLDHRGGQGCEANTGDGAGILLQVPDAFFRRELSKEGMTLPTDGEYGVGMLFLPQDDRIRTRFEKQLESIVREEGQTFIGWRTVPTDDGKLGDTAKSVQPYVRQIFIGQQGHLEGELGFERKLYVIRKRAEQEIRYSGAEGGDSFYFSSLSSKTIVYKGMLIPEQVDSYYSELRDPIVEKAN